MRIHRVRPFVLIGSSLLLSFFSWVSQETPTIYLVGDSTMSAKDTSAFPETGWGMPFAYFFDQPVKVENHAKNGRSTKSFREEGRWQPVMDGLSPGDYVFIQFGHNDEVPSKVGRYTTPEEFQQNLRRYVNDTRAGGGTPVLLTPVARRKFEDGRLVDTHEQYSGLVRDVASGEEVTLIDLDSLSRELLRELGEEKSKLLYLHLEPGEHPNHPGGKTDDTHFNELGARMMAQLVYAEIRRQQLPLVAYFAGRSGE